MTGAPRSTQRVWLCPRCGRTRQGVGLEASRPRCRNDLEEMLLVRVPAVGPAGIADRNGKDRRKAAPSTSKFSGNSQPISSSKNSKRTRRQGPGKTRKKR